MDRKRIMLTDKEIMALRGAIRHEVLEKEEVLRMLYGTEGNAGFIKEEIAALKSALNKLDAASHGKKGK